MSDRKHLLWSMLVVSWCTLVAQDAIDIHSHDRARILEAAAHAMELPPVTITAYPSPRSSGGLHDFHSEGDYWWPDSTDPNAPYVRRDGLTNPDNFVQHRQAVFTMNRTVATLAAGAIITGDRRYAIRALEHLRAWFVQPATRMNPHLLYAQAIKGRVTGRGIGIIDTIHLIETARSIQVLVRDGFLTVAEVEPVVVWFTDYLRWLTTHPYGLEERRAENNHGTWWVAQVAVFASLTGNTALMDSCRVRFQTVLLPVQMAANGSFPLETARTKPFAYSLFNLEGLALIAHVVSRPDNDLWKFTTSDGRGMQRALEFIRPFMSDRSGWPFPPDVMYDELFPVRYLFLLTGGLAYGDAASLALWRRLTADPDNDEVQRNMPLRQPVLWLNGRP